jgi:hypothetical protein
MADLGSSAHTGDGFARPLNGAGFGIGTRGFGGQLIVRQGGCAITDRLVRVGEIELSLSAGRACGGGILVVAERTVQVSSGKPFAAFTGGLAHHGRVATVGRSWRRAPMLGLLRLQSRHLTLELVELGLLLGELLVAGVYCVLKASAKECQEREEDQDCSGLARDHVL